MSASLQKDILYTVSYFNAMNYPLTTFELWRYCISRRQKEKSSLLEIKRAIKTQPLKKYLRIKNGFIFLDKEDDLVEKRLKNQKISLSNIRRIKKWSSVFRFIPFVRGVFITGTLSMKNARKQSDWDVLMVLAKDRIWIGRLIVGIVLQLLGKRRHGGKVKNRFCLNHYVTENGVILEEHNEYSAYFTTFSIPVIGKGIHKKFLQLNEQWVKGEYCNYEKDELTEGDLFFIPSVPSIFQKAAESLLEVTRLASLVNSIAKKVMINKIESNPKTHLKDADIRYDDCALIFLPNPHRLTVSACAHQKLTRLLS